MRAAEDREDGNYRIETGRRALDPGSLRQARELPRSIHAKLQRRDRLGRATGKVIGLNVSVANFSCLRVVISIESAGAVVRDHQ